MESPNANIQTLGETIAIDDSTKRLSEVIRTAQSTILGQESTVRFPGLEVEDALGIAERTDA